MRDTHYENSSTTILMFGRTIMTRIDLAKRKSKIHDTYNFIVLRLVGEVRIDATVIFFQNFQIETGEM